MAEIINLRTRRKAKLRREGQEQAAQNRLHFGRSKAEKQLTQAENRLEQTRLEGHRREGHRRDGQRPDDET